MFGSMHVGGRAPRDEVGKDGDTYLQLDNEAGPIVYGPKSRGTWRASKKTPLTGPDFVPPRRRLSWSSLWLAWADGWGILGPAVLGWLLWGTNR